MWVARVAREQREKKMNAGAAAPARKPLSLAQVHYSWDPASSPGATSQAIPITKDQTIVVFQKFDNGWWVGQIEGTSTMGIFPGTYVKETQVFPQILAVTTTIQPAVSTTTVATDKSILSQVGKRGSTALLTTEPVADTRERCIAIKSYKGTSPQLSFEEGDEIIVIERWQTGWCRGICNGKTGLFAK